MQTNILFFFSILREDDPQRSGGLRWPSQAALKPLSYPLPTPFPGSLPLITWRLLCSSVTRSCQTLVQLYPSEESYRLSLMCLRQHFLAKSFSLRELWWELQSCFQIPVCLTAVVAAGWWCMVRHSDTSPLVGFQLLVFVGETVS